MVDPCCCCVCFFKYNTEDRRPWDLGCGHCVCEACFYKTVKKRAICPECRKGFCHPHLQYAVLRILESKAKLSSHPISCVITEEDTVQPSGLLHNWRSPLKWRQPAADHVVPSAPPIAGMNAELVPWHNTELRPSSELQPCRQLSSGSSSSSCSSSNSLILSGGVPLGHAGWILATGPSFQDSMPDDQAARLLSACYAAAHDTQNVMQASAARTVLGLQRLGASLIDKMIPLFSRLPSPPNSSTIHYWLGSVALGLTAYHWHTSAVFLPTATAVFLLLVASTVPTKPSVPLVPFGLSRWMLILLKVACYLIASQLMLMAVAVLLWSADSATWHSWCYSRGLQLLPWCVKAVALLGGGLVVVAIWRRPCITDSDTRTRLLAVKCLAAAATAGVAGTSAALYLSAWLQKLYVLQQLGSLLLSVRDALRYRCGPCYGSSSNLQRLLELSEQAGYSQLQPSCRQLQPTLTQLPSTSSSIFATTSAMQTGARLLHNNQSASTSNSSATYHPNVQSQLNYSMPSPSLYTHSHNSSPAVYPPGSPHTYNSYPATFLSPSDSALYSHSQSSSSQPVFAAVMQRKLSHIQHPLSPQPTGPSPPLPPGPSKSSPAAGAKPAPPAKGGILRRRGARQSKDQQDAAAVASSSKVTTQQHAPVVPVAQQLLQPLQAYPPVPNGINGSLAYAEYPQQDPSSPAATPPTTYPFDHYCHHIILAIIMAASLYTAPGALTAFTMTPQWLCTAAVWLFRVVVCGGSMAMLLQHVVMGLDMTILLQELYNCKRQLLYLAAPMVLPALMVTLVCPALNISCEPWIHQASMLALTCMFVADVASVLGHWLLWAIEPYVYIQWRGNERPPCTRSHHGKVA